MSSSASFGLLLKNMRCQAGITQSELAEAIGKSGMYISNIEKGKNLSPPHEGDLSSLADQLCLTGKRRNDFMDAAAADRATLPTEMMDYIFRCPALKDLIRIGLGKKFDNKHWKELIDSYLGGNSNG